jgi:hypothetical protein
VSRPALWSTKPRTQGVPGDNLPGVMRPGCEGDRSSPSVVEVDDFGDIATLSRVFTAYCLIASFINHRNKSTYLPTYLPTYFLPISLPTYDSKIQFFSFLILYTVVGTPWIRDQPAARPLPAHRTTQSRNKCTDIHALSGIGTHDHSVRTSEDSSCLRPHDHCNRHTKRFTFIYFMQQANGDIDGTCNQYLT